MWSSKDVYVYVCVCHCDTFIIVSKVTFSNNLLELWITDIKLMFQLRVHLHDVPHISADRVDKQNKLTINPLKQKIDLTQS